jgi:hypothetical protein
MGLLLVFASGLVGRLTLIPAPLLFWSGVLLLPIAGFMAVTALTLAAPVWAVPVIVTGNALWVIVSLGLPLSGLIVPNALGWAFLLGQAAVVALFAWLEWSARAPSALVARA